MKDHSGDRAVLGSTAQNMLRVLIASYFLAGAIGLIPGTDLTSLTDRLLPTVLSAPVAGLTVFILAYLVMVGIWLRGAALLLGILTFWASYLHMIGLGLESELGVFWRDLALIASLMLTYAEPDAEAIENRNLLRRIQPRQEPPAPIMDHSMTWHEPVERTYGHEKLSVEELERLFHEDFEQARTN